MPSRPKTPVSFSDMILAQDRPTLVGRAIVHLVGAAGGGNGRCLTSDTLPRMGHHIVDDYDRFWTIQGYELVVDATKLALRMHVAQEGKAYLIEGPSMNHRLQAYLEVRHQPIRPDPILHLKRLYDKDMPEGLFIAVGEDLEKLFTLGGRIELLPTKCRISGAFLRAPR